jgi:hypothetical protein
LRLAPLLDDDAIDSAQTELYRKRDTDGSAADDDDLMPFFHSRVGALVKTSRRDEVIARFGLFCKRRVCVDVRLLAEQ